MFEPGVGVVEFDGKSPLGSEGVARGCREWEDTMKRREERIVMRKKKRDRCILIKM